MTPSYSYGAYNVGLNAAFSALAIAAATRLGGIKRIAAVASILTTSIAAHLFTRDPVYMTLTGENEGPYDGLSNEPILRAVLGTCIVAKHLIDVGAYCGIGAALRSWPGASIPKRLLSGTSLALCGLYGASRVADSTTLPGHLVTPEAQVELLSEVGPFRLLAKLSP